MTDKIYTEYVDYLVDFFGLLWAYFTIMCGVFTHVEIVIYYDLEFTREDAII